MDILKLDIPLTKPIEYISDYWLRRRQKQDLLVQSLWNLLIYFNDLGIDENKPTIYKIRFSPTYYVNDKYGSKNPNDIIVDITNILQTYGWENPNIVPILYNFKLFLENYKKYGENQIIINDKKKFVSNLEENVNSLQKLVETYWSKPSRIIKIWIIFTNLHYSQTIHRNVVYICNYNS